MSDKVQKLEQTHEEDQKVHEQDQQKIQQLQQQVGETQKAATEAQQEAGTAAQMKRKMNQLKNRLGKHKLPLQRRKESGGGGPGATGRSDPSGPLATHNFTLVGDAEVLNSARSRASTAPSRWPISRRSSCSGQRQHAVRGGFRHHAAERLGDAGERPNRQQRHATSIDLSFATIGLSAQ